MNSTTKIVIFEDEYLLANDLKRQLDRFGYEVTAMFRKAEDGLEFLAAVKDPLQFPDVILMDITLAGKMTGTEAAVIIAGKYTCALVFITGMSQHEFFEEAFQAKPFAFLSKPFEISQAVVSIKLAIYQRGLEMQLIQCRKEIEERVENRNQAFAIAQKTAGEAIQAKKLFLEQFSGQIPDPVSGPTGVSAMLKKEIKNKPELVLYTEYLEDNSFRLFTLLNCLSDLVEDDLR